MNCKKSAGILKMTNKKLIIITTSYRINKERKEPISAIDRCDGVYFRLLRKYIREEKLRNVDILIVSEKFGLIWAKDKIPYYEVHGKMGSLSLEKKAMEDLRQQNLQKLKEVVNRYSEIYVNVGREYMKLIEGFEKFTTRKITYSVGKGLGPKALHMKEWIISQ